MSLAVLGWVLPSGLFPPHLPRTSCKFSFRCFVMPWFSIAVTFSLTAHGEGQLSKRTQLQFRVTMEAKVVRGDSAKQYREKQGSLDRKPKMAKALLPAADLLTELVSLRLQTTEFFKKERGLSGLGLNPKLPSDMACVAIEKLEEVWGKCSASRPPIQL
jgi:hypothetical protein